MVDLSVTGGRLKDLGLAGSDADEGPQVIDSLYNEATTGGIDTLGTIDFGVGVAQGALDNSCKPISGNGDICVGISTRLPLMSGSPPNNIIGWRSQHMVGVKRRGTQYAIPCEDVRARDQVLAIVAQGGQLAGTKGGVAGTGRLLAPGAVWLTTTSAGQVGIIEIEKRIDPVLTT
jgi:hypothetical protein